LKSLICYLLKIKCIISVPISAAHFTYAFLGGRLGLGNMLSFDPGWFPWGQAFELKNWSEFKSPAYARPPQRKYVCVRRLGLPLKQLNIDRCIRTQSTSLIYLSCQRCETRNRLALHADAQGKRSSCQVLRIILAQKKYFLWYISYFLTRQITC